MKLCLLLVLLVCSGTYSTYAQFSGIGVVSPTNTLHVRPLGTADPVRIEGLNAGAAGETHILAVDPATGVLKTIARNTITDDQVLTYDPSTTTLTLEDGGTPIVLSGLRDNLGNHTATQDLTMMGHEITFGSQLAQHINLWSTTYGIGIQSNTHYARTAANFAWYRGGDHNDGILNAGTGGTTAMSLDENSKLTVAGRVEFTDFLMGNGKIALGTTDNWLRLNQNGNFTNGVYTPNLLRVDGGFIHNDNGTVVDARFETDNNAHALYIQGATDRIGIGTATPLTRLHVSGGSATFNTASNADPVIIARGNTRDQALEIGIDDTATNFAYNNDEAAALLKFSINNTDTETGGGANANSRDVMSILGNQIGGFVGVNTDAPTSSLTVIGDARITTMTVAAASDDIVTVDATGVLRKRAASSFGGDNLGNHIMSQNLETTGRWLSSDGDNEGLFVAATGRVGIGTAAPGADFVVESNDPVFTHTFTQNTAGGRVIGSFRSNGGNVSTQYMNTTTNAFWSVGNRASDGDKFVISENHNISANERFTILKGGNVGIGTTNPGNMLTIQAEEPQLDLRDNSGTRLQLGYSETNTLLANSLAAQVVVNTTGDIQYSSRSNSNSTHRFYTPAGGVPVERMRVATNGNVGIGTDNPNANLHVDAGAVGDAILRLEADSDGSNDNDNPQIVFEQDAGLEVSAIGHGLISGSNSNTLQIANAINVGGIEFLTGAGTAGYGAATSAMKITIARDVGIGTVNPSEKLDVNGTVRIRSIPNGAASDEVVTVNASGVLRKRAASSFGGDNLGNHIMTQNLETTGRWLSNDGGNEGIFVAASGNVGVGTNNPSRILEVTQPGNGNPGMNVNTNNLIKVATTNNSSSAGIMMEARTSGGALRQYSMGINPNFLGGSFAIIDQNNHDFFAYQTTTGDISLNPSYGNVGIGIRNPNQKLHVIGNIQATGNVTTSDSTLKADIIPLTYGLTELLQLEPVTYTWKDKLQAEQGYDSALQIGFLAQQMQAIIPEAVIGEEGKGMGIDYGKVMPVVVAAVQEQNAQVVKLQEQNKQLKTELDDLRQIVMKMQANGR